MSFINILVGVLPYLTPLLAFFSSSGKDRDNLLEKLRQELHQDTPTPFIIESLSAKLHRWRPLAASELIDIFRRDNAWVFFRLLAPARRGIVMIKLSGRGENASFCYNGLYAHIIFRLFIFILCASLSAYFMYCAVGVEIDILKVIDHENFIKDDSRKIAELVFGMATYIVAYFMTAFHALSILLGAFRIYALNTLLHPDLTENHIRLKKWLMGVVMILITDVHRQA
ncbi:hypothetical protein ACOZB2_29010 [Pantoea endophytica]